MVLMFRFFKVADIGQLFSRTLRKTDCWLVFLISNRYANMLYYLKFVLSKDGELEKRDICLYATHSAHSFNISFYARLQSS
jgi:hypothetical protein